LRGSRAHWAVLLERATDHPLTLLALVLLPLLLAPFLVTLSPGLAEVLGKADGIIWAVFAGTLLAALLVSPDRSRYLRRHWLDLLLVVVPLVGLVRAARALRLVWALGAAVRVLHGSRRLLVRRGTSFLLLGVSLVVVVAAGLIVAVERDDPHATIHTYGDGLWWALTTIATVGYGDKYPVTAEGRGLAVALMLVGIAAFGVLTAELVALFAGEPDDTANRQLLEVDARLGRIEDALLPMQRRYTRKAAQARSRNRRRKRRNRMIAPPRSAEAGPPALSQQSVLAHRSVPIVTSRRQEDRKSISVASSDSAQSLR
jgi:voltage-gated potassium channel